MKRLLMLCYYFPPLGMGGAQRPAKFAKYLPSYGWQPTILTVRAISYWAEDSSTLRELGGVQIVRTDSLDPQRLLVRMGVHRTPSAEVNRLNRSFFSYVMLPDSNILWWPDAMRAARKLIARTPFHALYTTSPPHSLHLLGRNLAKSSGLPWVADFRDRWAGGVVVHEPTRFHRRLNRALQRKVARAADRLVCVTPSLADDLRSTGGRIIDVIPNGYDPEDFPSPGRRDPDQRHFIFCHCGSITRFSHPGPLFRALAWLKEREPAIMDRIAFHFVGLDTLGDFAARVQAADLGSCIHHLGYLPHRRALQHLVDADALVLIAMGEPHDGFIPGKTYEYLGARKPVLALSNVSDTLELLRQHPLILTPDVNDPAGIARAILALMRDAGSGTRKGMRNLGAFDRRRQAEKLAVLLDEMTAATERKRLSR